MLLYVPIEVDFRIHNHRIGRRLAGAWQQFAAEGPDDPFGGDPMTDAHRIMLVPSAVLLLSACFGVSAFAADAPADGVWRFNFAPADAPDVESFVTVSGKTLYDKAAGYGWTDARGELESGKYEGGGLKSWESRANLNVICRLTPDALARSYATGPATFALDLPAGRYEVWVLSGDAGLLEDTPHEPYRILVEDAVACSFHMTPDEFYRRFEDPIVEDELTPSGVWRQCVAPRFRWSAVTVDVADGQLSVRVDCPRRDLALFNFIGDYAITETRGGPKVRYAGALNALVVMKAGKDAVAGLAGDRPDRRLAAGGFCEAFPDGSRRTRREGELVGRGRAARLCPVRAEYHRAGPAPDARRGGRARAVVPRDARRIPAHHVRALPVQGPGRHRAARERVHRRRQGLGPHPARRGALRSAALRAGAGRRYPVGAGARDDRCRGPLADRRRRRPAVLADLSRPRRHARRPLRGRRHAGARERRARDHCAEARGAPLQAGAAHGSRHGHDVLQPHPVFLLRRGPLLEAHGG